MSRFLSVLPETLSSSSDAMERWMKDGTGIMWGDLPDSVFTAVAKFFQPVYKFLLPHWFATATELTSINQTLSTTAGSKILDVGCGFGVSTRVLGNLFPKSKIIGVDYHAHSIETAKEKTVEEGLTNVDYICCNSASPNWHGRYLSLESKRECPWSSMGKHNDR